jgi:uncharacterized protein (TIGR03790 family)
MCRTLAGAFTNGQGKFCHKKCKAILRWNGWTFSLIRTMNVNMLTRLCMGGLMALLIFLPRAWAGESGLNVIVVVNQNSSNSLQLGNDYCERRGVPPQNLLRMTNWMGGSITWQQSDFDNCLLNPLLSMISSHGLTNQAQIVLLSMNIPYRVIASDGQSENSTTSALFYGIKTDTAPPDGLPDSCSLPVDSTNSYSYSELPFALAPPGTAVTNSFLAVMLTDTNLAEAEATLLKGESSDGTLPAETVYLEKTSDNTRNVRFLLFDNAIQESRARGDNFLQRTNSDSTAMTNVLGLDTGLADFSLEENTFVPGAVADSLTSFGGFILENSGQTPLLAFLEAGASASYGTVVEPCNYTYKFPDPMVYFYQDRGFCLAESYYQSLATPYQGLIVGEPLAAPFARRGAGAWNFPTNGSEVSGLANFSLSFSAADTNHPFAQVDLFVDGSFVETITNILPSAGNKLSVTINNTPVNYAIAPGDSLGSAASGLASALAAQENTMGVQAVAVGDRLVLRSQNVATLGSQISVRASATLGAGGSLTSFATAAEPTFLDSTAYGYQLVQASNNPVMGDWLQMTIVKTNGTQVSLAVTNFQTGQSITSFLQVLMNEINGTNILQTADGVTASDLLEWNTDSYGFLVNASSPGWPAAQIQAVLTGSPDMGITPNTTNTLDNNVNDLQPRAHVYLDCGAVLLPVNFTLDTTKFTDGFHTLAAVAYEGTSVRTQTRIAETLQFHNTTLSATFPAPMATSSGNLQFTVGASATNITRIELFSTGGSVAVATNQATAQLVASTATLGVGLHPFNAVVTDTSGHQYQTPTIWEQMPASVLSVTAAPRALNWPAIVGRQYSVLATTNLAIPFQTIGTLTATNSQAQWPINTSTGGTVFYQVSVTP